MRPCTILTTLCLKKVSTFKLSVTSSNLKRFSIFALLESVRNLLRSPYDTIHLTLDMLLHYLGTLQIYFFADIQQMEENANKLHFECTDFNSSTRVTVYDECICVLMEYLKYLTYECVAIFFDKMSVRALRGLPLPGRLSTVPVSRNFFNSLLTPPLAFVQLFSGNSSVNLFAVYPFKYKLFI